MPTARCSAKVSASSRSRLADAERDGDHIYAVVKSLEGASDGRALSVYAPLAKGQARAIRRTYESAGFSPETVELVDAHGTGTRAGDAAEFAGLKMVFEESSAAKQWCALGSIKSQIGHLKAAAGAAGIFKMVMALNEGVLPPTIGIETPNPKLDIPNSPFYLNTELRPWVRGAAHPRRAAVSSFGFGGSNWHMLLEEDTGPGANANRLRVSPTEVVLLDADKLAARVTRCREVAVEAMAESRLRWLAGAVSSRGNPTPGARVVRRRDNGTIRGGAEQGRRRSRLRRRRRSAIPAARRSQGRRSPGSVAFLFPVGAARHRHDGGSGDGVRIRTRRVGRRGRCVVWRCELAYPACTTSCSQPVFSEDERASRCALRATEDAAGALGAEPRLAGRCSIRRVHADLDGRPQLR